MAINDYWFSLFYEIRAFYENGLSMEKDLHSEFIFKILDDSVSLFSSGKLKTN